MNLKISFQSFLIRGFFKGKILISYLKVMHHMGHVTKFLLIFRNNLRPHEKRYRFETLRNELKDTYLWYFCIVKKMLNSTKFFCF